VVPSDFRNVFKIQALDHPVPFIDAFPDDLRKFLRKPRTAVVVWGGQPPRRITEDEARQWQHGNMATQPTGHPETTGSVTRATSITKGAGAPCAWFISTYNVLLLAGERDAAASTAVHVGPKACAAHESSLEDMVKVTDVISCRRVIIIRRGVPSASQCFQETHGRPWKPRPLGSPEFLAADRYNGYSADIE